MISGNSDERGLCGLDRSGGVSPHRLSNPSSSPTARPTRTTLSSPPHTSHHPPAPRPRERGQGAGDRVDHLVRAAADVGGDDGLQPRLAELLALAVQRVGHAVGVEYQQVAGGQGQALLRQLDPLERAQDDAALAQLGDRAGGGVIPQRPVVAGVGVGQPAGVQLQHRVDRGQEHVGLAVLQDERIGAHAGPRPGRGR